MLLSVVVSCGLLAVACSQIPGAKPETAQPEVVPAPLPSQSSVTPQPAAVEPAPELPPTREEILEMGTGNYVGTSPAPANAPADMDPRDITLNFEATELRDFVKVILGDVFHEHYMIDPAVTGKVTVQTAEPISKAELLPLFENILAMNGAAAVKSDNVYRIVPRAKAVRGTLTPAVETQSQAAGYRVRIIPLQYVAATEMQKILEPFLAEGGQLQVDPKRNLIIATGTESEIARIQETVDIFDVDTMQGMSIGLYPLDYVDPKTMKSELEAVIGAMNGEKTPVLQGGLVRIVSLDRLDSILLIGATPAALRDVEIWLHRLDRPGEKVGKRLYVYDVQNAKATELAEVLGHIFGKGAGQQQKASRVELAPGLTPVEIESEPAVEAQMGAPPVAAREDRLTESGIDIALQGEIDIIADDTRNALVVLATPQNYKMVESALHRLDVVPLQVLIEASILEVTLRDDLSLGVEWFFKNSVRASSDKEGRGVLDLGAAGLAALSPGFAYTVIDNADQVRLALNALAEESEIKVLSSPSLMVLDNQTAMINVGDEIPLPTRQSVSNVDPNAPTVNEIQFRQTGVTLTVTPRVNKSGLVTMEIRQEVSNAVSTTSSEIDAPTIQQRQVESVVAINSGQTIVLGGLIQDTQTVTDSGLPFLHKIPIIGNFFGQTRDESRRTELLVLLTPRVVQNRDDAKDITEEFRRKLRGIESLDPS